MSFSQEFLIGNKDIPVAFGVRKIGSLCLVGRIDCAN
jgi:hypothetical protein